MAFLDDDDEYLPEAVRRQAEALDRAPPTVGGAYVGYIIVSDHTGELISDHLPMPVDNLGRELRKVNHVGSTSCAMVRRSCFDAVGGFDETLAPLEDWDLWIRLTDRYNLVLVPERLLIYHVHGPQISGNPDANRRSLQVFEQRYLDSTPEMRHAYGLHELRLGIDFCLADRPSEGRHHLLRAIRLRPTDLRAYVYGFASCFGADGVRAIVAWRRRRKSVHSQPFQAGSGNSRYPHRSGAARVPAIGGRPRERDASGTPSNRCNSS